MTAKKSTLTMESALRAKADNLDILAQAEMARASAYKARFEASQVQMGVMHINHQKMINEMRLDLAKASESYGNILQAKDAELIQLRDAKSHAVNGLNSKIMNLSAELGRAEFEIDRLNGRLKRRRWWQIWKRWPKAKIYGNPN